MTIIMKTKHAFYKIMALLFIASSFAHASPKGEGNASQQSTRIISEPALMATSATLVSAYNQANQESAVILSRVYDSEFEKEFRSGGSVALVTKGSGSGLSSGESWTMAIGREVIIPVMNENHPRVSRIRQEGISPEKFAGMVSGKDHIYLSKEPFAVSYVADFLGMEPDQIPGTLQKSPEEVVELIRNNPESMGFIRLTSVIDPGNLNMVEGVCPVPIDLNGDGVLSTAEDIYRSPRELVHGITIGKYPKNLYTKVYAITSRKPVETGEVAFLEWLLQDGQQYLASAGLMQLSAYEKLSIHRHLAEEPGVAVSVPLEASPGKVVYLVVGLLAAIFLIVLLVMAWVSRNSKEVSSPDHPRPALGTESLSFPGGLFFDRSHTWTFMEKDGLVRIGLDDFLLHVTGKVTRIELKKPGEKIKKGELLMKIIQQGKQLEVRSPLSGVVAHSNNQLETNAPCLNESPYSEGWVYLVEPLQWVTEMKSFLMGERYREWIRKEFVRLKDFFSEGIALVVGGVPVPVIQDGGEVEYGILETFGPEVWEEFQTRFINHSA